MDPIIINISIHDFIILLKYFTNGSTDFSSVWNIIHFLFIWMFCSLIVFWERVYQFLLPIKRWKYLFPSYLSLFSGSLFSISLILHRIYYKFQFKFQFFLLIDKECDLLTSYHTLCEHFHLIIEMPAVMFNMHNWFSFFCLSCSAAHIKANFKEARLPSGKFT